MATGGEGDDVGVVARLVPPSGGNVEIGRDMADRKPESVEPITQVRVGQPVADEGERNSSQHRRSLRRAPRGSARGPSAEAARKKGGHPPEWPRRPATPRPVRCRRRGSQHFPDVPGTENKPVGRLDSEIETLQALRERDGVALEVGLVESEIALLLQRLGIGTRAADDNAPRGSEPVAHIVKGDGTRCVVMENA